MTEKEVEEILKRLKDKFDAERREWNKERKELKETIDLLRYAIKGICADRLSIRYSISEQMVSQKSLDLVQNLVSHHAIATAHKIEERLGDRFELLMAYDKAREYIHYLQSHANSRGVQFTPFEERVFQ